MPQCLQALGRSITQEIFKRTLIPLGNWFIPISQDMKYGLKIGKRSHFSPVWTGPHAVVLATPTAVKVTGVTPGFTTPESR